MELDQHLDSKDHDLKKKKITNMPKINGFERKTWIHK